MKCKLSEMKTKVVEGHLIHEIEYSEEFDEHLLDEYGIDTTGVWIESEDNLSQEGDAAVLDNAVV